MLLSLLDGRKGREREKERKRERERGREREGVKGGIGWENQYFSSIRDSLVVILGRMLDSLQTNICDHIRSGG